MWYRENSRDNTINRQQEELECRERELYRKNAITSDMQMTPPLYRKQKGTKKPLDESETEEWKSRLKTQHSQNEDYGIQSYHFMANGEIMETVTDFIFLDSKITVDDDCSYEIKTCLLFGRKAMTNKDSILKRRDFTLLTNVQIVKVMVFPVVMYGCESCTIRRAEHWRIDAFELWCCGRLLRVPWTATSPS